MNLTQWALRWGLSHEMLADLKRELGFDQTSIEVIREGATSETGAAQRMQLDANNQGVVMWRNNVGAYQDDRGQWIRYGLANISKQMNKKVKSSDYIGIKPLLITHDMVGTYVGQFVARETKKPGWNYSGTEREVAQAKFISIVISYGGDASFSTGNF